MAIKKISEFTSGIPTESDMILFEQSGAGKSTTIRNAVNTCSLTYEEIMASTNLTGKVASASALKDYIKLLIVNKVFTFKANSKGEFQVDYTIPAGYTIIGITFDCTSRDYINMGLVDISSTYSKFGYSSTHTADLERIVFLRIILLKV